MEHEDREEDSVTIAFHK